MAMIFDDPINRQRPELSLADALQVTYQSLADKHANKKVFTLLHALASAPTSARPI
jgi:hypothetical protein